MPPSNDVIVPAPPTCGLPACEAPAQLLGLCAEHYTTFSSSVEFSRVRTALSDWARRLDEERRNAGNAE